MKYLKSFPRKQSSAVGSSLFLARPAQRPKRWPGLSVCPCKAFVWFLASRSAHPDRMVQLGSRCLVLMVSHILVSCHDLRSAPSNRRALRLVSNDRFLEGTLHRLRPKSPVLRLVGGADVAKRKILDEYSHEVKSRHEGKGGTVSVEVKNRCPPVGFVS